MYEKTDVENTDRNCIIWTWWTDRQFIEGEMIKDRNFSNLFINFYILKHKVARYFLVSETSIYWFEFSFKEFCCMCADIVTLRKSNNVKIFVWNDDYEYHEECIFYYYVWTFWLVSHDTDLLHVMSSIIWWYIMIVEFSFQQCMYLWAILYSLNFVSKN